MSVFPGAIPPTGSASASATLAASGHTALHNTEYNEINAIATKVGTGASTPASGLLLRGNGAGTSAWGQVNQATDVTGVLPIANGGTGGASASAAATNLATEVGKLLFPIGCIYIETTGANPSTSLGFGTWVAFGAGQTLIGVGTSDQAFAAGATGGESNHILTSNEMPSHTHTQDAHNHPPGGAGASFVQAGGGAGAGIPITGASYNTASTTGNTTATNQNTGGGLTHNNLSPYIVTYFWKRTA